MRRIGLACLLWAAASYAALGWGQEGHAVVAEIAQRRLDSQARGLAARLLGEGRSLASVSSWADDVRAVRPKTYNWHFVDIPLDAGSYQPERDCRADPELGDCVVAAIQRARRDLACGTLDGERADALRFLVHFVGDVHQPLHNVGEARGGNDVRVELHARGLTCTGACVPRREAMSLHAAWDTGMIQRVARNWGAYVERLEAGFLRSAEAQGAVGGTPADWSSEAHRAGQDAWRAVPNAMVLDDAYFKAALPVLDRQLGVAGLRLALLLNEAAAAACP